MIHRVSREERTVDLLDIIGDALSLGEQLLGTLDRLFQLQQRRERQRGQILRLVDQHLRLVLQRHDLVVDLLQGTSGRQYVLRIVIGIEHDQLRGGGFGTDKHSKRNHAGGSETMEAVHLDASNSARCGMRSVAQATSRAFSQPGTKLSRPFSAKTCSISAWSALEEAAVKASATSPRPSSNRRLPRRDWQ